MRYEYNILLSKRETSKSRRVHRNGLQDNIKMDLTVKSCDDAAFRLDSYVRWRALVNLVTELMALSEHGNFS